MPLDPIRPLVDRQLASWRADSQLAAAQLYLISRSHSLDVEVSKVGESPTLSKNDLENLLIKAATSQEMGFEIEFGARGALAYPLRQDTMLQGVWVLFPAPGEPSLAVWKRDCLRFANELFALRQASLGDPPTFRQLVESFPDYQESEPDPTPPLHWESSRSRVVVAVEDELSSCLLVDHLPIF